MNAVSTAAHREWCWYCQNEYATALAHDAPSCIDCLRSLDPLSCAEPPSSPRIVVEREYTCRCGTTVRLDDCADLGRQDMGDGTWARLYHCVACGTSFLIEEEGDR